jgi:ubiquinone biosynthesis protein
VPAGLTLRHLGRYRDIAGLLRRHARAAGLPGGAPGAGPEDLARDLEALGPTFVKLAQLLSTRSDLLPQPYLDALERLQDAVKPFPFEEARRIVEEELGGKLRHLFRRFEREPVAAASLSQIHRAELRDGTVVAVKVQRPGLHDIVEEDMAALAEAAELLDRHTRFGRRYEFGRLVEEMRRSLLAELDFRAEAQNLRALAENLEDFDRLLVPAPHEDYCSGRVLTMDFVRGRKVTALSPLALQELDGGAMAGQLFRAYLRQILVDGFFHADPHPGNLLVVRGGRLAILDLGMVARLGPALQQKLLSLLLAVSEGRGDDAASISIEAGVKREDFTEVAFRERVDALVLEKRDATIAEMDLGRVVFEIARISGECGLRPPRELALIGKALLNLDRVVSALDPDFSPADCVRDEAPLLLRERMDRSMSRANLASSMLELREFAGRLPARLGKLLDVLGGNEIRVKVDALDETLLIQGMQKIANRIAMGVVLAALIIGAALMMQVQTTFRILEYPGVAILLFGAAAFGACVLLLDILYYDDKRKVSLRAAPDREPPE